VKTRLFMLAAYSAGLTLLGTAVAAAAGTVNPVNVAQSAGIYEVTRTFSVNPVDYNDNWAGNYPDDFFFVRHNPDLGVDNLPISTLWRNRSDETYVDSGSRTGQSDKHGCDWADYNDDGRPDLACAIGFGQNSKNELWRQNSDRGFTNVAGALGLTQGTHGRYRYVTFIDVNNDGHPDLYFARYYGASVPNDPTSPSYYPGDEFPNELWINRGARAATPFSFRKAPEYGVNALDGARKDAASCAQPVDFDKDGDHDLLVCGEKALKLYRNDFPAEHFTPVTEAMNAGMSGVRDAVVRDLNGDGITELVRLSSQAFKISTRTSRTAPWSSTAYSFALTQGESLATGDFDGDGRKDLFVVAQKGHDRQDDPDYLVMQDGNLTFHRINMGTNGGSGDDVAVVDYNRDNMADFIVTNGDKKKAGPVQLWTNRP
jgi:FG-GAP-like repeat